MAVQDPAALSVAYRTIEGMDGYRFGDDGVAWGCHVCQVNRHGEWRRLSVRRTNEEYPTVEVRWRGRTERIQVYKLILWAFVGPCPDASEVVFADGDPLNCSSSNLQWKPLEETRLWSKLKRTESGCWEWQGSKCRGGYGSLTFRSKTRMAHQLAYEFKYGSTNGLDVLHRCDNPPCCNPEHLFLGTQKDNYDDMVAKGRRVISVVPLEKQLKGESQKTSKLTNEQVLAIRRDYKPKVVTQRQLAATYGVTKTVIIRILLRRAWKHI